MLPFAGGPAAPTGGSQAPSGPQEGVLGVSSENPDANQANNGLLPVTGALGMTLLLLVAGLALVLLGGGLILRRRRMAAVETHRA